mgnify:CR=1 FL=1
MKKLEEIEKEIAAQLAEMEEINRMKRSKSLRPVGWTIEDVYRAAKVIEDRIADLSMKKRKLNIE